MRQERSWREASTWSRAIAARWSKGWQRPERRSLLRQSNGSWFLSRLTQKGKTKRAGRVTSPPWRRWDSGVQIRMPSPKSSSRELLAGACIRSCQPCEPPFVPALDRSCAAVQLHPGTDCLQCSLPGLYRELRMAVANRCPSGQAAIPRKEVFLWWTRESRASANSRTAPGGRSAFWARRRSLPVLRTCLRRGYSSPPQSPIYFRWSAAARRTCWIPPSATSREYAPEYFLRSRPARGQRTWVQAPSDTRRRCRQSAPVHRECQGAEPERQSQQCCRRKNTAPACPPR